MKLAMLENEGESITDSNMLKEHVTEFYKKLFGEAQTADIHLEDTMWTSEQQISQEENDWLTRPFTLEELDTAIKEMKNNTAPGPDGFSIEFFKCFWSLIRDDIKEMLDYLHEDKLDLWRLNYGVISCFQK